MKIADLKKKKLPQKPGVYFFKKGREILYIGKATNLQDRTKSYFARDLIKTRSPLILDMVTLATNVTWEETDTVLEALVLESALIKKHQPKYNIKEKDNRSYYSVIITDENFPRVLVVRDREIKMGKVPPIKKEFGPFPNSSQLKEALKIIRKLFPFFDKQGAGDRPRVSKLNVQLGLEPDLEKISRTEYLRNIRNISLFFEGKKSKVIKLLKSEMFKHSEEREFEKATHIKKTIFALEHINDVSLLDRNKIDDLQNSTAKNFRIESYDIAHLSGQNTVGAMVVMVDGEFEKSDYRKFIIKNSKPGDDTGALKEVLSRRFKHDEWQLPKLIVIDGGKAQKNAANKVLKEFGYQIPVVSVVKDEKHKPRDILHDANSKNFSQTYANQIIKVNAETHRFAIGFYRKRSRRMLK